MANEEYITVAQASELSGLSRRQIQWLLQNAVIVGVKLGRDWLVKPSAVTEYLKEVRKPGPKPKER